MNICLIKPPILHKGASFALMPSPPLGLAYIAGALKRYNHDLSVIDCSAAGISDVEYHSNGVYLFGLNIKNTVNRIPVNVDIVCISSMFTNNWLYERELIKAVKEKFSEAIVIVGGEHANAAPELCFTQSPIDYIVFGEGEETIVDLMQTIEAKGDFSKVLGIVFKKDGKLVFNKKRRRISAIENIARPAWELFPLDDYFKHEMSYGLFRGNTLPVMATRGCPYTCTFCSNPQMWGKKYEMRPAQDFVDELEYLYKTYNVVNFELYDLTAVIFKKWIVEMCQEILDRGLDITYQLPSGTRSEAIDYEVASLLYKSGCKNITYAPESGSERVLRDIKKRVKIDKMLQSISYSSKVGMNIKLNMIIGFPDDTHRDIWATIWFLIKCSWYGANDTAPAIFSPYPGSALFDRLQEEKKLNIYDDEYIYEIINSYDLWPGKIYCNNISSFMLKIYSFVILITFYASNFLFRPQRFFFTIRNLITQKHESRLEQILHKNFFKNFFGLTLFSKVKKHETF